MVARTRFYVEKIGVDDHGCGGVRSCLGEGQRARPVLARHRLSAATGFCPPCPHPLGLAGDSIVSVSYGEGIDLGPVG